MRVNTQHTNASRIIKCDYNVDLYRMWLEKGISSRLSQVLSICCVFPTINETGEFLIPKLDWMDEFIAQEDYLIAEFFEAKAKGNEILFCLSVLSKLKKIPCDTLEYVALRIVEQLDDNIKKVPEGKLTFDILHKAIQKLKSRAKQVRLYCELIDYRCLNDFSSYSLDKFKNFLESNTELIICRPKFKSEKICKNEQDRDELAFWLGDKGFSQRSNSEKERDQNRNPFLDDSDSDIPVDLPNKKAAKITVVDPTTGKEKEEYRYPQFCQKYVVNNPIRQSWIEEMRADGKASIEKKVLADLYLSKGHYFDPSKIQIEKENGRTCLWVEDTQSYNNAPLNYNLLQGATFNEVLLKKSKKAISRFEIAPDLEIALEKLRKIEFKRKQIELFNNYIYSNGVNERLSELFNNYTNSTNEVVFHYCTFTQDFLNLQYSNGLDFLRSSCKNYLIKSINITIPGAAKVIGCNRGNPYILKHSILTEALCFARKNKPARFSDTSQIARAFVLATFIGDRGSNRPLIEYCKTGNLVEVNRADKGDDHRYSVVSHKLFTPSTINYLKEVTSSEDRLRNLLFTNAFRHFGAYLILNFLKFKDEEERALYLELYLNDIATQTNNSKVKLNLQNHSKILSDKFANYIIEEVHNVYAA